MLCFKSRARLVVSLGLLVLMTVTAGACSGPAQLAAVPREPAPAEQPVVTPTTEQPLQTTYGATSENAADNATPAVRIFQIHFRGSLEALGCCDNQLYERDEFVAIQNAGNTPQDISGWKLVNATRGYPVFTFPSYFPCIAFTPSSDSKYVANIQNYTASAPQSIDQDFPSSQGTQQTQGATATPIPSQIDWSSCVPIDPLDESPMKPAKGQQPGTMAPLVLYPGQIVLVFTDEIHCQYGGLSFRYGLGNLWSNENPDTAVLYNSNGKEVSRRSYTLGR